MDDEKTKKGFTPANSKKHLAEVFHLKGATAGTKNQLVNRWLERRRNLNHTDKHIRTGDLPTPPPKKTKRKERTPDM